MSRRTAFLAGIGVAYLFDPANGKRRRHVLRDRSVRALRRTERLGRRKSRYLLGRLRGVAARARRPFRPPVVAVDDRTVEQRVKSDAFRDVGVSTQQVEVHVEDGVVTLLGTVDASTLADDLVARVRRVPGVVDVAAMLRVGREQRKDAAYAGSRTESTPSTPE